MLDDSAENIQRLQVELWTLWNTVWYEDFKPTIDYNDLFPAGGKEAHVPVVVR
jgi:hypothetical protein